MLKGFSVLKIWIEREYVPIYVGLEAVSFCQKMEIHLNLYLGNYSPLLIKLDP